MEQIDVLIVAALKIEREAILAQLPGATKVQKDDSFTYFVSTLEVGEAETYRVAVVSLLEMGNTEAALRTARAIAESRPRCVLMVGIAGGIKSQVELGDVIVADQIFYYELAKQRAGGETDFRPRVIQIDRHMLDRAHHYDNATWIDKIGTARPDGTSDSQPSVRFGPIAVGEKVVTDPEMVAKLQRQHSKMLGVDMESYGVAAAVADASERPTYLSVRGVCDFADPQKNDNWHAYAAHSAAAFAVGFLRSAPLRRQESAAASPDLPVVHLIVHQSMETFSAEDVKVEVSKQFPGSKVRTFVIGQTDLYSDGVLLNPSNAVAIQSHVIKEAKASIGVHPPTELAYGGIAHVPLLFLAGFQIATKGKILLLEHHRDTGTWDHLAGPEHGPDFELESSFTASKSAGDVVLRMSVSFNVDERLTAAACPAPLTSIHLKVPEPGRDIVTHASVLERYSRTFRDTLDAISSSMPNTNRIHVFYAGPASLAFSCGRQISRTTHPEVVVHNFAARPKPHYSWAVVINPTGSDSGFVINP